ncbi:AGC family protein kinase [Histomonas meleagridis]|uniref:AGC family protein kinase n=1 Tax=Histomonas meleagridis TaxID=135588 RepID=UPI00355AA428|nr:AGC family protein kinase [Histomonas meleagridis]KAH0797824.1 AGC family protein kinase [Histomonas meleagridis]
MTWFDQLFGRFNQENILQHGPVTVSTDPFHPSRETLVKVELVKHFIETYYENLIKENEEKSKSLQQTDNRSNNSLSQIEYAEKMSNILREQRRKLSQDQFRRIRQIGRGAFADVWLVKDIITKNHYAMKILKKSELVAKKQIYNTISERDVLTSSDTNTNPWIVELIHSFQDENHLYFVMEYLPGGDMMNLLIKRGTLTESEARFYLAETLLAIHSVHESGFIHRDIKPDNLLFTKTGHIKLTDFGLSAKSDGYPDTYMQHVKYANDIFLRKDSMNQRKALYSTVGTPDYIAPEILLKKPYDQSVDYWSFGIILYEVLFGSPPFMANTARETAINIVKWRETLKFPANTNVSLNAIKLIQRLLCSKEYRFNYEQIKEHPFFEGIDFDHIREMVPPIVPKLNGDWDTSNFDEFVPREDTPEIEQNQIINMAFIGFRYTKKNYAHTLPIMRTDKDRKKKKEKKMTMDDEHMYRTLK